MCNKNCENGVGVFRQFTTRCGKCNYHYLCLKLKYFDELHSLKCGCGFIVIVKSWDKTLRRVIGEHCDYECEKFAHTLHVDEFNSRIISATRRYYEIMYKTSNEFDKVIRTRAVIKIQKRWRGVRTRMQLANPKSELGMRRLNNEWIGLCRSI